MKQIIGDGHSEKKARNMTVKRVPFCKSTVNKIVKEKSKFGDLVDGPSPRTRLAQFEKLSFEMKDKIRHTVSSYFHNDTTDQCCHTVWKFQHFSVTQFLPEIVY